MTLQLLHSKFDFLFYQCTVGCHGDCSVPVILLGEEGEEEEDAGQLVDHVE